MCGSHRLAMFSQVAQRFAYSHFPAIIAPPRAVEQLEMQQSGLQRGFRNSDWSKPFQLPQCGLLVSNSASLMEPEARRFRICSPRFGH
jgi:hypothetical protein